MLDDGVDRNNQQQRQADADQAGDETFNERFGIEDARDVALARADGAENTDLLRTFEHGDVGDDADHDGRDDERDGHECNQHIGNGVDDRGDRTHEQRDIVGIRDLLFVGDGLVIVRNAVGDGVLIRKRRSVEADLRRRCEIHIAERGEHVVIRRIGDGRGHVVVVEVLRLLLGARRHVERSGELVDGHGRELGARGFGILRGDLLADHVLDIGEERLVVHLFDVAHDLVAADAHLGGVGVGHLGDDALTGHALHGLFGHGVEIAACGLGHHGHIHVGLFLRAGRGDHVCNAGFHFVQRRGGLVPGRERES